MGTRGPAPRREGERRRRNAPDHPIVKMSRDDLQALPFEIDLEPEPPAAEEKWHPLVQEFWTALQHDPARKWMTSADWAAAKLHFESISRDLKPQVVSVSEDGEPVMAVVPIKGANLAAYQKFLAAIGVMEANRLRIQKEITLFPPPETVIEGENVTDIATRRQDDVQ